MTGHRTAPSPDWGDAHALSGAYAVDALDDIERARFEAHLAGCDDCRNEVDSLREAASLLGAGEEVTPPPSLRDQLLAGIAEIRPLPPEVPSTAAPAAEQTIPETADPAPAPPTPTSAPVDLASRRRLFRRLPLLAAAAALVLLAAGLALMNPWSGDDPGQLTATERVLQADDATKAALEFPDGSGAEVVLSRSEGRAVISTHDMAPAPEGLVYQLWLQTESGGMVPAGLMPDDPDTTLLLDGDASEVSGVGITVEPDGGSDEPTSDPIAVFALGV